MVVLSLALTDQLPFNQVLLHGLVCHKNGKKMSKSVGNVIDPMEIICNLNSDQKSEKPAKIAVGFDAVRFALCRLGTQNQFVNVNDGFIQDMNKFCNKIWQAFYLCNETWKLFPVEKATNDDHVAINIWILSCLNDLIATCHDAMKNYNLDVAANALFSFWHDKFCDIYLECAKIPLKNVDSSDICENISHTMFTVFDVYLRLLSLFMPNLSEELYQRLPIVFAESICIAKYPEVTEMDLKEDVIVGMDSVVKIGAAVRSIKTEFGGFREKTPVLILCGEDLRRKLLPLLDYLSVISRASRCEILTDEKQIPQRCATQLLEDGISVFVPFEGSFDFEKEIERLGSQKAKLDVKLAEDEVILKKDNYDRRSEKFRQGVETRIAELKGKIEEVERVQAKVKSVKR